MARKDLISIIVPIYNTPEFYLKECIKSICEQSYSELEIILVDDGSPDECGRIVDQYSRKDTRIVPIHKENGGVSSARNIGIERATGRYLMFVDADDYLFTDCVRKLYSEIKENDVDLVKCSCIHLNKSVKNCNELKSKIEYNKLITSVQKALDNLYYSYAPFDEMEVSAVWGCLFKREVCKGMTFKPYNIGEDVVFMKEYLSKISCVEYISSKEYVYRGNADGAMSQKYGDEIFPTVNGLACEIEIYKGENLSGFSARILNALITIYILLNGNANKSALKIESTVKKYRFKVLTDKRIKKKLRIALLLTFIGIKNMKKIYTKFNTSKILCKN